MITAGVGLLGLDPAIFANTAIAGSFNSLVGQLLSTVTNDTLLVAVTSFTALLPPSLPGANVTYTVSAPAGTPPQPILAAIILATNGSDLALVLTLGDPGDFGNITGTVITIAPFVSSFGSTGQSGLSSGAIAGSRARLLLPASCRRQAL